MCCGLPLVHYEADAANWAASVAQLVKKYVCILQGGGLGKIFRGANQCFEK